jgi:hypothetical protein
MTSPSRDAVHATEAAARHLVGECRKGGPLYGRSPRAVAQVSRTAQWLRNALDRLRRELRGSDAAAP